MYRHSFFITRKSSQPSSTQIVNLSYEMPDRSSEVRWRHVLAGTEGHSHLVIWVNYKCCRPQGGKMSWAAVSVHKHTHSAAHMHWEKSPKITSQGVHRGQKAISYSQVELGKGSQLQQLNSFPFSFLSQTRPRQDMIEYYVFFGFIHH